MFPKPVLGLPLCLAMMFGALPATAADADAPVPRLPVESFFKHSQFGQVQLSPNGKMLAALAPFKGRLNLVVIDLDTRAAKRLTSFTSEDAANVVWVNDHRLVFSVMDRKAGLGEQVGGGMFAINTDGSGAKELVPTAERQADSSTWIRQFTVLRRYDDGSDDILVTGNDRYAKYIDAYRLNTRTGRKELLTFDNPGKVSRYVFDALGTARIAISESDDGKFVTIWQREGQEGKVAKTDRVEDDGVGYFADRLRDRWQDAVCVGAQRRG